MITITKPARPELKLKGKCQSCGCEIECDAFDATYFSDPRGHELGAAQHFVECPECKHSFLWVK